MSTGPSINIQTKLGAPANIAAVANQIRRGLGGINADVKINLAQDTKSKLTTTNAALKEIQRNIIAINSASSNLGNNFGKATVAIKNMGAAGKEINSITVSTGKLNNNLDKTGNTIAAVTARFSAFVLVAQTFNKVAASIGEGVTEALDFQRELVRLKQVGDDTSYTIKSIGDQAIRLGKNLGTSSNELIKVASTLRQAGLSANDTKLAMETLAKTRLSPSFTDLTNTVEGAIAVIGQFKLQAKDLTGVFDSINSVSKAFAVESNDLVTGIRLAGAAFSQAGGDLNEFLAIFTAIRSQTRESAESIGTGLKTIFTRLQRKDSVDALKNLGVNLRDAKGQFVGVYEGIRRIAQGLSQINPRSQQFADIVEQIGGLRQVNKILPLITNQKTLVEALNVAKKSSNSLDRDAAVGQEALIVKLTKLKESFFEIFKILSENKQILGFVDNLTRMGDAAVVLVKKLEPLIPILVTMAAIRIGTGVSAVAKTLGKQALGFNTGGKIPGKSHGDVQPIMAEPGEFIIKKRAAQKIGYDALERLNHGGMDGFASGGEVIKNISASFAQTSIGSQKDFDEFIREQIDKVYKGQGRPRGDRGLYIKKTDFEAMVREALGGSYQDPNTIPSFTPSARTVLPGRNRPSSSNQAGYGPVAAAYNTRPSGPSGFATLFDSASITRQNKTEEVVRVLKDVAKNTDPQNPVSKSISFSEALKGSFGLNPLDTNSSLRKFTAEIIRPEQPSELPFDINLNPSDPFARNRSSAQRVSLPRNPELPFEVGLDPAVGRTRNRFANIPLPSVNYVRPYAEGEIGLNPANGRARNRTAPNIPLPSINFVRPYAEGEIGLDSASGRARNRFNTDTSIAQNDPFAVLPNSDIALSPFIYPGRRRGFDTAPLPSIDFVAPYPLTDNVTLDPLTGRNRVKANMSSSFNADVLKDQTQLALQKQIAAQKRFNVDIPGVGNINLSRDNDEAVNAYNATVKANRANAIEYFKNNRTNISPVLNRTAIINASRQKYLPDGSINEDAYYAKGRTEQKLLLARSGGNSTIPFGPDISRTQRPKRENPFVNYSAEEQRIIRGIGQKQSNNIKNVQDLYQGKASASLPKYNKALEQVTSLLQFQVQALQKGKVGEAQYNKVRDAAIKALQDNIKVFTDGKGSIKGLVGNSLAQSLTELSFGQRFAQGFAPRFASFRDTLNFRGNNRGNDRSFEGLGSFYANPTNFFASDGKTTVNPATVFAGLSSDGTVAGNKTAVAGPRGSRLKGVGKLAGIAAAIGLLNFAADSRNGGFLSSVGRVAGQGFNGGLAGGGIGGLAGSLGAGPIGGVGLGAIGAVVGTIGGIGKGIYDEIQGAKAGPSGADIKKAILDNEGIKAYTAGELTLGKVGKDSANRLGAQNPILTQLTQLNNISKGELNKLKLNNRVGLTNFGNGEDADTIDYINKFKQNDIRGIKDGGRQLAQSLFEDRLRTGAVTSKNFDKYTGTEEFRQIREALNTSVGDPVAEAAGRNNVTVELRAQVAAMEKEKASRTELLATYSKEQEELNKLNFAYSKTLDGLNRFFDGLGKATERLNESFDALSFNASANLGEGGVQPFKFRVSDFGPQGAQLEQFAGRGGILENLKESLPSLIETAIQTERNNPNIGFADALKIGLNAKGFDPSVTDNVVARAKSDPKIATEYLNGRAPEVLQSLLKPFEPFAESFKKLSSEGEEAGRKLVQGLAQYAENVTKINEGLTQRDLLRVNNLQERNRQRSFFDFSNPEGQLPLSVLQAPALNEQRRLTGLENPTAAGIEPLLAQRQRELATAQANNDPIAIQGAQTAISQLIQALKNFTDVSKVAAGVAEKLARAEKDFADDRNGRNENLKSLITGGPAERREFFLNRQAAQAAAIGGLNNLPGGLFGPNAARAVRGLEQLGGQQIQVGVQNQLIGGRRGRNGGVVGQRLQFRPKDAPPIFRRADEVLNELLNQQFNNGVGDAIVGGQRGRNGGIVGGQRIRNFNFGNGDAVAQQLQGNVQGLQGLRNNFNNNAMEAQNILNKNLQDANEQFLQKLDTLFQKYFAATGGKGPVINQAQLNINQQQPAQQQQAAPNLRQRRNPFGQPLEPNAFDVLDNPNVKQKVLNFAAPGGQQDNAGVLGTFNDLTVKLNQLNTTLGQLNIPSEIKVTLNASPINLNLNGVELLAQFSKEIQALVFKTISEEFAKRAVNFVNNLPPKI